MGKNAKWRGLLVEKLIYRDMKEDEDTPVITDTYTARRYGYGVDLAVDLGRSFCSTLQFTTKKFWGHNETTEGTGQVQKLVKGLDSVFVTISGRSVL